MEWISVEDYTPCDQEIVIVSDIISRVVSLAKVIIEDDEYYFHVMYIDNIEIDSIVTHWMPLPEMPK